MRTASLSSNNGVKDHGTFSLGAVYAADRPARRGFLSGLTARLRSAFRFKIPEGYQDESGFHFGPYHADAAHNDHHLR